MEEKGREGEGKGVERKYTQDYTCDPLFIFLML